MYKMPDSIQIHRFKVAYNSKLVSHKSQKEQLPSKKSTLVQLSAHTEPGVVIHERPALSLNIDTT